MPAVRISGRRESGKARRQRQWGGKDNGEAKTTGAEGGSRRLTDEVSIMLISSPVGVGTENYDKTKLTSRKTSEFHYISLVRMHTVNKEAQIIMR